MGRPAFFNMIGVFFLAALWCFLAAGCDSKPVGKTAASADQTPAATVSVKPTQPEKAITVRPEKPVYQPIVWTVPSPESDPQPILSGKYYLMSGKRYNLLASSRGYVREGEASWYGKRFHGRKTSSGERYNMNELTAAHRTLPFNTLVRVINLDNSREVTVRVNDRGPFEGRGRVIDLSFAAAKALGMVKPGKAPVRIEAIGSGDNLVSFPGKVLRVLSGDTLEVFRGNHPLTIRLKGVDCPENDQPWGKRARYFTTDLAGDKEVRVKGGGEVPDGPMEAEVWLKDGRRLGIELIKAGLGWWHREYEGQGRLLATLHLEAQYSRRGLWSDENPVPPWEWRRLRTEMRHARSGDPILSDVMKGAVD